MSTAEEADKPVLRRLIELYRYDFSEFDGRDLDVHGEFGYRYLDNYWNDAERHPFLFKVGGRWAGFALLRSGSPSDGRPLTRPDVRDERPTCR